MEKTIHFALYLFLVTGLLFNGCAKQELLDPEAMGGSLEESLMADPSEEAMEEAVEEAVEEPVEENADPETGAYLDGTYTQTADYLVPDGSATIAVSLSLQNDLVTGVSIQNLAKDDVSKKFVDLFSAGVETMVVGKPLSELGGLGAVNGSSLTPKGFNTAVQAIMEEAQR
jgi:hypothetical protein